MKKKVLFPVLVMVLGLTLGLATPAMAWWEWNTTVTIDGPTDPVPAGSPVTLTITETNDGEPSDEFPPNYMWISDVWVSLEPGGIILDETTLLSGDVNGDGLLNWLETWAWEVTVTVEEDTLFTAIGHGWAQDREDRGWDVTYGVLDDEGNMAFPSELAEFTVYVTPPDDGEGLTPGFWKNHLDEWANTDYSPSDEFNSVFGAGPYITLLEAVNLGGGDANALGRHAVAALLNASHPGVDYAMTVGEVIEAVQDAYASGDFEDTKDMFEGHNETDFELYD